jgi:crotonobetainyl-CoA:carnitine CoA-transferase CaiB-like acyl-CoA transferase
MLEGITVLDLSRVLAGPYATQILGDLGAEVWKIERPGDGDETRAWGPPFVDDRSGYYVSTNRNKKSVVADLRLAEHRAAVRRAALAADVVVENFLPGALAKFGLDAASLRAERPELIVCSITGFGQDGPEAQRPGYDAVMQGHVGLMSVTGHADGPALKVGVAVTDVMTGAHAAAAILGALAARGLGRGGAHLDVALVDVGVAMLVNLVQATLLTGTPPKRHGNAHPFIVPYETFQASDGALVVACGNDEQWVRLCHALGKPEWTEIEAWRTNPGRVAARDQVIPALAERFATRPRDTWLNDLRAADVPAGAVRDLAEVLGDSTLRERGLITHVSAGDSAPGTEVNVLPLLALPWLVGGVRPPVRLPPPHLGEHTAEFFARFG